MKTKRGRRGATRWKRERGGELVKGGGQGIPSSLLFFLGYIYNAVSFLKIVPRVAHRAPLSITRVGGRL